jgi:cytochrome c biogenesis protein CcdA/thiol-disulfide isomerase/thioredoxin
MLLLLVVAVTAGLATAVSPCVLPILPIVLATGADGDRRRPFLVIAGLIASFSFFTLASVQIINALHLPSSILRDAAIVIIAIFGLTLLVPALGTRFERLTARLTGLGARMTEAGRDTPAPLGGAGVALGRASGASGAGGAGVALGGRAGFTPDGQPRRRSGPAGIVGGLVTGVGLGLVWTPCAGPILGAITSLAVTAPGSLATVALVIAYAIGAGLPLLAIAIGGRVALARLRLRSASAWAARAFGILVLATAGLMAVGADTALSADLTSALPSWTGTLQTLERARPVQYALHDVGVAGAGSGLVGPGTGVSGLPLGPAAPDFTGVDRWLNSSPLTMAGLRGKVVLVDFWTYSCINCIRTLPYVEAWYQKYAAQGFVVVGVHTPEFAFEHDTANVQAAIARFGITYPVAQDNAYGTWSAYTNQYWPADYLIDATGHIRSEHFGEGDYNQTEDEIRGLLAEAGPAALPSAAAAAPTPPFVGGQTRESYIGTDRANSFASPQQAQPGGSKYTFPSSLPDDQFAVSGAFDFEPEYATATARGDQLELSFYARDVYLVASADSPVPAIVQVTGATGAGPTEDVGSDGALEIGGARLYHLVHLPAAARGTVIITFDAAGARAYAFTFGG